MNKYTVSIPITGYISLGWEGRFDDPMWEATEAVCRGNVFSCMLNEQIASKDD